MRQDTKLTEERQAKPTTSHFVTLAERAIACGPWRWIPGMLIQGGSPLHRGAPATQRIDERVPRPVLSDALPDFRDPATLGCLLALVREAWDEPTLTPNFETASRCERHGVPGPRWLVCPDDADRPGIGSTEAEALVDALEMLS
jgi:hypothetical protein